MQILFHCKPEILEEVDDIKNSKIVSIDPDNISEVDIILEIDPVINEQLDFDEFTEYFGINYDLVNCIEAHDFCAV